MKRDYSKFLRPPATDGSPKRIPSQLEMLGWKPFFAQQISTEDMGRTPPVRIIEVQRSGFRVLGDGIDTIVPPNPEATVGDWLLLDEARPGSCEVLERKSLIKRRAPGSDRQVQLIAANIDTAFIVSSCNQDFNVARLERYIAVAFEAGVSPVIILTKSDLCETPDNYVSEASGISDLVPVVVLDARGDEPRQKLADWCKPGQTVAFLGSSGVGKSTLTNALLQSLSIHTQAIREDDAKGRHTTTSRRLHILPDACAVLDTPGMRELQLADVETGLAHLFSDIDALTLQCRFKDCQHVSEPGCAVLAAVETGDIDEVRLGRWRKLIAEERFNTSSLAQRRSKDKAFGKMIRTIKKQSKR